MTQVDFYILGSGGEDARLVTACKVVEKAWRRGLRVVVRAEDAAQARSVDTLLWTFRQESFLPHEAIAADGRLAAERSDSPQVDTADAGAVGATGDAEPGRVPVLVAAGDTAPGRVPRDVLVNVGQSLPSLADPPERIAEFVPADEAGRTAGRARYRQYRELGYELQTHEL